RHTRWPRDWSSDVCSSDLRRPDGFLPWWLKDALRRVLRISGRYRGRPSSNCGGWAIAVPSALMLSAGIVGLPNVGKSTLFNAVKIGRASCRERVVDLGVVI